MVFRLISSPIEKPFCILCNLLIADTDLSQLEFAVGVFKAVTLSMANGSQTAISLESSVYFIISSTPI